MTSHEALFKYTLRLGDTSLIIAQRLSEWTGHGPFLEEDLALTNIALDIFGRGKSLLEYAAKIEGKGRTEDDLAFFRNDREYFNALITEQPNGDYAKTVIRQAIIDCFDLLFYTELAKSKDVTLSGIAEKSMKEITYHKRHSFSWVNRFGNGTEESFSRLQKGLNEIWPYAGELFEMNDIDSILIDEARTPLILSSYKENENINKLYLAKAIANILEKEVHFQLDEKRKDINLTEEGYRETKKRLGIKSLYDPGDPWILDILNALKAKYLFKLNKDYIILNSTAAKQNDVDNGITTTSSTFNIKYGLNVSGETYVAYLFAHNAGGFGLTGTDN
ncbi:MAG: 1,2-phenylacetyl-CoA epoxidase subunit PaaC, partial [Bacteroidota bacterium]